LTAGRPRITPQSPETRAPPHFYRGADDLLQHFPDQRPFIFLPHSVVISALFVHFKFVHFKKVKRMKFARISTSLGALAILSGALLAAPTCARANDFALPFGARLSSPSVSGLFVTAAQISIITSAHALVSPLATHEDHPGLGGSLACQTTEWNMHEGKGEWHHHDDDGGDDDHGGKSVPEPSTGFLVFSGVSALAGWRLRRLLQPGIPANVA
jgi:hypothetical protein